MTDRDLAAREAAAVTVAERPFQGRPARWAALAAVTLVSFLLLLDDTAIALAMPVMRREFSFGLAGTEWVVNGYTLLLAAFMLPAGQLADRYGRRRLFLIGLATFAFASLLSGLASGTAMLIGFRAVQGIGAALLAPASLSLIVDAFPPHQRGWALGVWSGVTATALGFGPLMGALITQQLGWRWIFLLNVPLGAAAWVVAFNLLRESRSTHPALRIDIGGVLTSGIALTALLLLLIGGNGYGWDSWRSLALGVTVVFSLFAFVFVERRTSDPLVDLSTLRQPSVAGPNVVILLTTSVMCSLLFFIALYLQGVLGYSSIKAGQALLPLTAAIVLAAPLSGRLADRVGARMPATVGTLMLAVALFGLARLRLDSSASSLVPWFLLSGVGIGLITAPVTSAAMADPNADRYGAAAGVFNTFRATGLALGIALMGAVLASFGADSSQDQNKFVGGFSRALMINAAIALLTAIVAALTLSGRRDNCRPRSTASAPPACERRHETL